MQTSISNPTTINHIVALYSVLDTEDDVDRLLKKTSIHLDYVDVQAEEYATTIRNHWPLLRPLNPALQRISSTMLRQQ